MKKIICLLLLLCMLWGCTPAAEPESTTAPTVPTTVPETEPVISEYIEETVVLEAVNKHAFYKTSESPTGAVLDERAVAFVTNEYLNKDFTKKYTHIRLVDPHTGEMRTETYLDGTYSLLPHCNGQGVLALVDKDGDAVLVLDKNLRQVMTFRARALDGVLTGDLDSYYYIWGSKL